MDDFIEDRRQHYLQLAARLRVVAREARFPAARKVLLQVAKRFERKASDPEPA
jgi:chorismate-pyruvate lyase